MKLGLRISHGAAKHLRDFLMLVALDFMQQENGSVSVGQLLDCVSQCNSVDAARQAIVSGSVLPAYLGAVAIAVRFVQGNLGQGLLAKMHQHRVYRNAVKPG